MGKWGNADFKRLIRLQEKMQKLEKAGFDKFCEDAAKEIASRLLAKVIKHTPVGNYDDGKVGGTLRRGWTAKSEREAELSSTFGGGNGVKKYAETLEVIKRGNLYEVWVINPVEYSSYVEYGHRTSNHQGWVKGRFMMTISANEVESQAPTILEKKLAKLLGEAFDGD